MKQIYIDVDQCQELSLSYWEPVEPIWVIASRILDSKRQGYDKHHKEILEPIGDGPVLICRDKLSAPGWYDIVC